MSTVNSSNLNRIGQLSAHQQFIDQDGVLTKQAYRFLDALSSQAMSSLGSTTSATSGSASALPSAPAGYLEVGINGSTVKVPYYNP